MKQNHINLSQINPKKQSKFNSFINSIKPREIIIEHHQNCYQKEYKSLNKNIYKNKNKINGTPKHAKSYRPFFQNIATTVSQKSIEQEDKSSCRQLVQLSLPIQLKQIKESSSPLTHQIHTISKNKLVKINIIPQNSIHKDDYDKYLYLLQHYSYEVFSVPNKFKRFTKLLKHRYPTVGNVNQTQLAIELTRKGSRFQKHKTDHKQKEVIRQNRHLMATSQAYKLNKSIFQSYSPKVGLKRRPSSGIPLNKNGAIYSIKSKKITKFGPINNSSLQFRQISALDFTQRKNKKQTQKYSKCYQAENEMMANCKKQCDLRYSTAPLQRQTTGPLQPWEFEIDKLKNLSDIQVNIRLQRV